MIPARLLTCTNRQARRSLRSSPCDSNSVFEWADTVYKYAPNRLKSSANVRGAISPAQSADITVAEQQYHCAIRKLKIERIKEKHGEFRAFRKNAMKRKNEPKASIKQTILRNCGLSFVRLVLRAKIFCAIRKLKIERIKEKHGKFRAFRKNASKRKNEPKASIKQTILRNCGLSFVRLILRAKIFCAIRKLKIERIKEKHGKFRAFRKNAMIFS